MNYLADTIAAIATAPGRGGVGVIRLSGRNLLPLAGQVSGGRQPRPRHALYTDFVAADGQAIDSGLLLYFPAPHSFTGEDVLELQGHGGPVILRMLLARCLELGARLAEPGEFTKRAFLNDKMDLVEAESVADLIDAQSETAARSALKSLKGAFSAEIHCLVDTLIDLRMLTEATLDFPEEDDVEWLEKADALGRLAAVRRQLATVLATARQGAILREGMHVVLVGQPNVGKSSLMNALCGPSVAEADMLFATLDPTSRKLILPSGMAVLLVDTVGFVSRLPHNLVEAFKSTLEEAAWSDVIIRVADAGDEQREEQLAVTDEVLDGLDCADIPRLTVYNKCDKPGAMSFDPDILLTSAKTGYGLDTLLAKLDEVLSDRVHTLKVLLPYDKLGLAAPMRERGSVQVEEYREDGLYLEGIVKTEDLHCFEGYLV